MFKGEGRFNPTLGYMPSALMIAHEFGHTKFGEYYLDHENDKIALESGEGIPEPTGDKKYNVEGNENPMRQAYGMDDREGYRENEICYDKDGLELKDENGDKTCPTYYEQDFELEDISKPELVQEQNL
jgi:hypothetical protein